MADECDLCGGTQEIEMFERGPVPCPSCIGREYDGMIEAKDARIKELEAALKDAQGALAMLIEPAGIIGSTVLHAFARVTEAEAHARKTLSPSPTQEQTK